MNSYHYPTPRTVSGVIAVALTALTIGLFAVLPAETGPSGRTQEIATAAPVAPATRSSAASTEVRYIETIEVVGVRAPKVLTSQDSEAPARRGEQG